MKLLINPELKENEVGIPEEIWPHDQEEGTLALGQWSQNVTVKRISGEDIQIPENFFPFDPPVELPFSWKLNDDTLKLGPVIAYFPRDEKKTYDGITVYNKFMKHYPDVLGLIFISTTEQTDVDREVMKGFFYHPEKKKFDPVERTFPFPDVIYRRCGFRDRKKYRVIKEKLQGKIFNAPVLNKYRQVQIFRGMEDIQAHFPKTRRLKSLRTVDYLLKTYPTVYIKPIYSQKAEGILTVRKLKENLYVLQEEKKKTKLTKKELRHVLTELKNRRKYIVQQGVSSPGDKNIVLRAIMQKNDKNEWLFSGGYARIGNKESVVTNRMYTKEFLTLEEAFLRYYQLNEAEAKRLVDKVVATCREVCEGYDQTKVNFGDLAFDLIADEALKIWVIEVNNRAHNRSSPLLTIKDRKMYERVITTPLLYAKYLSGF